MEGIIDKENERVRRFFALLDNMEKKVERLARDNRPPFNGERFLTDRELWYAHIAFSVGSKEKVDALTIELKTDGYEVISGPRTTGDGYYESCIVAIEGNQIEITV